MLIIGANLDAGCTREIITKHPKMPANGNAIRYKLALDSSINKNVDIKPSRPTTPIPSITSCARFSISALKFCGIHETARAEPKKSPSE